MTTHVRQQIREAAATLLTGLATTGSRVYQSRMRPNDLDAGACLLVETNDEAVRAANIGTLQDRELTLTVRGFAKGASVDDTLDAIALDVETAIAASPTISGKAKSAALNNIKVEFDDSNNEPVGAISLDFTVFYLVNAGSPGTAL